MVATVVRGLVAAMAGMTLAVVLLTVLLLIWAALSG